MRLLVVEDDAQLRARLAEHFQSVGWVVEQAADGREGLYQGEEFSFDLAIVDLGLPGLDGIELIRQWRQHNRSFPILVLTARDNWQDKVEGLEAGADDYVTKPFHLPEIEARVNALLRRAGGRVQSVVRYGAVSMDFAARQVCFGDQPLELTSFEYNTLEYLVHHADRVVTKAELTEHLYQQDFERDSNVIEVFVGRLRRKLDPEGELKPIQTVRGAGYRFVLQADAP
jgi:two-component system, OmpR family, response regulator PhoP